MAAGFDYVHSAIPHTKPKGYKLRFITEYVASPVLTGKKDGKGIEARDGYLQVELVYTETNQRVIEGPLASKRVNIVLLPEDFGAVWTPLQFNNSILNNWGKKKNILLGDDLSINLENGRGTIVQIWIKHDKNHLSKVKFRLGAMIDDDCCYEIKEAITQPFEVKDRRNELTSKNRPLRLDDKVSQLKNIGRRGPCCKRLVDENIRTIKDFLDKLSSDLLALRKIYGSSGKRWEQTVRHAKTSISDKECNNACESVGSAFHGAEIAPILVNHDSLGELEVGSYEPSPSSNDTMSISLENFDFWFEQYDDENMYEDPYLWTY